MAIYEIGAFTEQELLDQGTAGTNIGRGDVFVMPATTSVTMEVTDNDPALSGDRRNDENADDRTGQTATIFESGVVTSEGEQIYAECYYWVRDAFSNWYIMIEIEVEGGSSDYFTFYGDVPPEGATLTIACGGNVKCNWVRYCNLMEPDAIKPPYAEDDTVAIAEDETASLNVLDNDFDLDGQQISVQSVFGGTVGAPFEVLSVEGYAALVTLEADGSLTVVPGPEFELMGEGQSTTISFDYTIVDTDGLTATASVTVTIEGEGGDIAVADAFTVLESESFGDTDGNVLANDIDGNADGTFNIVEANGNPDWVGAIIQGSNGGYAVLNPDGSFDFSANGDFDALSDGQSAETVFTYALASGGGTVSDGLVISMDGPNGLSAQITIIEDAGELVITVEVFSDGGDIGDIRGLFFDVADESLLSGMSAHGYDVTDQRFDANNVVDLGGGNNVNGDIVLNLGAFDAGTELGTQGIGRDDIRATTFKLTHDTVDLSLDLLMNQDFALRLTSVGPEDGNRDDSLKLGATSGTVTTEVSTTTVTVTVEGETIYVAEDDAVTVMESETAGDLETLDSGASTVLANDTQDGAAYQGQVVNGGVQVTGSNGGLATIYADGSIDFDANDEFDFLAAGESTTTTFSYEITGGETADVTVNVLGEDDPVSGEVVNIAIMLNSAQTMYASAQGTIIGVPAYPDYNSDGLANQLMDMAYFMLNDFISDAFADAAASGVSLNVSLISFGDGGGGEGSDYWTVNGESDWAGQLDAKITMDDSADHGNGFANADAWFDTVETPTSTNAVIVVSDGFSSDPWLMEKADLIANHNAQIDAYFPDLDIGTAGGVSALNQMDKDGVAEQVWTNDTVLADSLGAIAAQDVLDFNQFI